MNRYSTDKDLNKFANEQAALGWIITMSGRGHLAWQHPSGARFWSSQTPSCPFAIKKIKADLRKALAKVGINTHPRTQEEQAQLQEKIHQREERMQQPLKHSINIPSSNFPAASSLPKPLPTPKEREIMFVISAGHRLHDLVKQGKTPEEAVTILTTAYKIMSPIHMTEMARERLVAIAGDPLWGAGKKQLAAAKGETKEVKPPKKEKEKEKAVKVDPPYPALPVKHTASEIDEKLSHVRAVIALPLPKQQRMALIIDLLDSML